MGRFKMIASSSSRHLHELERREAALDLLPFQRDARGLELLVRAADDAFGLGLLANLAARLRDVARKGVSRPTD